MSTDILHASIFKKTSIVLIQYQVSNPLLSMNQPDEHQVFNLLQSKIRPETFSDILIQLSEGHQSDNNLPQNVATSSISYQLQSIFANSIQSNISLPSIKSRAARSTNQFTLRNVSYSPAMNVTRVKDQFLISVESKNFDELDHLLLL